MLQSLHVKNLALIDEAEVEFGEGLNILSGETGAGKSIIIGSVNLALGAKASADLIRRDAPFALIELVFTADRPQLTEKLEKMDIYPEDGQLLMTRKIMPGRSVCRINGETVSASVMRSVASLLIDIHGQHEHQSLLHTRNHLKYLDDYACDAVKELKEQTDRAFRVWQQKKADLEKADLDSEHRARELSFLQFEAEEIEQAQLSEGEDARLEEEFRKLSNGKKIIEAAAGAYEKTGGTDASASDLIGHGLRELISASGYDRKVQELCGQLQEIDSLLSDFNRDLSDYLSEMDFSEEQFVQIRDRLDEINHLKAKYGSSVQEIQAQLEEKKERIAQLEDFDTYRQDLEKECCRAQEELIRVSDKLSAVRKNYAQTMAVKIREALIDLNFLDVSFEIRMEKLDHFSASGTDDARFYISTNPGEPLRPLDQIASGGELSRIMLALKTVLAEKDEIETLIFDEIDAGISGRTAQMVARKMKITGKGRQIICITHLPQIAAMADIHFLIEKRADHGSTATQIRRLDFQESVEELARMLGGVKITDTVLESAKEMKEMADTEK